MQVPSEEDPLATEMEDLLQLVRNVTQTRVQSFHRIPASVYESMFRAIMPESAVSVQSLGDVASALRNELQAYGPPVLFPETSEAPSPTADFTFAHHIQLLSWLKDVAARNHVRFNVVPDAQLRDLQPAERDIDLLPPTPVKDASRARPRGSTATEAILAAIEREIEDRRQRVARLEASIDGLKRIILEESGSKRCLGLRKFLKNA